MSAALESAVTPEQVEAYQRDGVILVKGAFRDWVEPLRAGVAQVMDAPSPYERSYTPKDGSARFFQDLCNWQRIPELRDFVLNGPGAAIAAALMKSPVARFFHDHILVKEPGNSLVTPWHQDSPYYCVGGEQSVSFWIPLDPVARDTTLECVAGSHRWGVNHKPKRFDGTDLYEGDESVEMPDIDADRSKFEILGWAMEPGDAVAFDFHTIHGAPANRSATRRRVFSARWVGADAYFIDRKGRGSPPLRHLTLADGAPLDGPDFPVVFRA
jgi:ectoine hydroxylase-related dioxygenase (phytanoyl-CoA dioxygenase family)